MGYVLNKLLILAVLASGLITGQNAVTLNSTPVVPDQFVFQQPQPTVVGTVQQEYAPAIIQVTDTGYNSPTDMLQTAQGTFTYQGSEVQVQ
jgi:hypothetical protein